MFYNFQKPSFEFEINFLRELLGDVEVLFSNFEASNHFDNFRNIVLTDVSSEMELQVEVRRTITTFESNVCVSWSMTDGS